MLGYISSLKYLQKVRMKKNAIKKVNYIPVVCDVIQREVRLSNE